MFKKITLLMLLLFCRIISFAQKDDIVTTSVTYQVTFSAGSNVIINDACQLDIAKSKSYFYSLGKLAQAKSMIEKQRKAEQAKTSVNFAEGDFRRDLFEFSVIKDYGRKVAIVDERVGFQHLGYVRDSLSANGWKLSGEKRTLNGLLCRKATTAKGGIEVTAWFCPEVPLHEGPLFYYGLPGLIVSLSTSTGWQADMLSVNYSKGTAKELKIRAFIPVTIAQLEKAKKSAKASMEQGVLPNGDKVEKVKN